MSPAPLTPICPIVVVGFHQCSSQRLHEYGSFSMDLFRDLTMVFTSWHWRVSGTPQQECRGSLGSLVRKNPGCPVRVFSCPSPPTFFSFTHLLLVFTRQHILEESDCFFPRTLLMESLSHMRESYGRYSNTTKEKVSATHPPAGLHWFFRWNRNEMASIVICPPQQTPPI